MGKLLILFCVWVSIAASWIATRPQFVEGDCVVFVESAYSSFSSTCIAKVAIEPMDDQWCSTNGMYCYALSDITCEGEPVNHESLSIIVGKEVISKSNICPSDALDKSIVPTNVLGVY